MHIRQLAQLFGELEANFGENRKVVAPGIHILFSPPRGTGCKFIRDDAAVGSAPRGPRSPVVALGAIPEMTGQSANTSALIALEFTDAIRTRKQAVVN